MRQRQARLLHDLLAVEEQVEVDRAGPEARALAPDAAEAALDRQQPLEQLPRRQLGRELRGAVQETRLVLVARPGRSRAGSTLPPPRCPPPRREARAPSGSAPPGRRGSSRVRRKPWPCRPLFPSGGPRSQLPCASRAPSDADRGRVSRVLRAGDGGAARPSRQCRALGPCAGLAVGAKPPGLPARARRARPRSRSGRGRVAATGRRRADRAAAPALAAAERERAAPAPGAHAPRARAFGQP